ncbi:MAG: right-handed parallel beta-helix repeat-containing protein [Deltaproteobacteria bacterium]|nr:right-handed parallel beta-helix repeat-containing protein [Deltaproteobacteria bacterium]
MRSSILLPALALLVAGAASAKTVKTGPIDDVAFQALADNPSVDRIRLAGGDYTFAAPVSLSHAITIEAQDPRNRPRIHAATSAFTGPSTGTLKNIALRDLVIDAQAAAISFTPGLVRSGDDFQLVDGFLDGLEVSGSTLSGSDLGTIMVWGHAANITISGNSLTSGVSTDYNPLGNGSGLFLNSSDIGCGAGQGAPVGAVMANVRVANNEFSTLAAFDSGTIASLTVGVPGIEVSNNRVLSVFGVGFLVIGVDLANFPTDGSTPPPAAFFPAFSRVSGNYVKQSAVGAVTVGRVNVDHNEFHAFGIALTGGNDARISDNVFEATSGPGGVDAGPNTGVGLGSLCQLTNDVCPLTTAGVIADNRVSGFSGGIGSFDHSVTGNTIRVQARADGTAPGLQLFSDGRAIDVSENNVTFGDDQGADVMGLSLTAQGAVTVRENQLFLGQNAGPNSSGIQLEAHARSRVTDNFVWLRSGAGDQSQLGINVTGFADTLVEHNLIEGPFGASLAAITADPADFPGQVTANANVIRGAFLFGIGSVSSTITNNWLDLTADPTGTAQGIVTQDNDGFPSTVSGNHLLGLLNTAKPHNARPWCRRGSEGKRDLGRWVSRAFRGR